MTTVKLYCFCQDYLIVAARAEGYNLRNTVLKLYGFLSMTQKLALQYSWSRLGLNRQRKKALRNHRLVVLLESKCCMQLSIVLTYCFYVSEKKYLEQFAACRENAFPHGKLIDGGGENSNATILRFSKLLQ